MVAVLVAVRVSVGVDVVVGVDFDPITPQPVAVTETIASTRDGTSAQDGEGSLRTAPTRALVVVTFGVTGRRGSGGGAGMARTAA